MTARCRWILLLVTRLACAAPSDFVGNEAPVELPAPLGAAVARIDAGQLAAHIAWLAAPEREGRGLGTRGLDATAAYLADRLKTAGVPPPASGYYQPVPLREVSGAGGSITVATADRRNARAVAWKSAVLPGIAPQTITAPVVWVGHAIREAGLGHDDFRGLEVRGKVVLFRSGVPAGAEWQTSELLDRYASPRLADRYDARLALLKDLGAKAAIAIEDDLAERLRAGLEPDGTYFLAASGAPESGEPPLARVTTRLAEELAPDTLRGATATIRVTGVVRRAESRNVIGVLVGADPKLRSEAVVIGAHMDHLGMSGGVLHPGADDNASGTAALIEIARAFGASGVRPRRSVVFAFWTGEEAGQLGSSYYVQHPVWPLARTAAYLNLDMLAHPWSAAEIARLVRGEAGVRAGALLAAATPSNFAEPGVANWAPELLPPLAMAARGTGMVLHLDRVEGVNGGSDYRGFARRGVPWIRFFGNFFAGYHEPGDTPDGLDPAQVERMARLAFATAWLLAN